MLLPRPSHLPCQNHHKVHDVPAIAQVGALVQHEAQGHNLDARLKAEDADEVGFRVVLRRSTAHSPRRLPPPDSGRRRDPGQPLSLQQTGLSGPVGLSCTDRAIIHGLSHSFSPMLRDTEAERGHGTGPKTQLIRGTAARRASNCLDLGSAHCTSGLMDAPGPRAAQDAPSPSAHTFYTNEACRSWEPQGATGG